MLHPMFLAMMASQGSAATGFPLDGIATQPLVAMSFKKPTSTFVGGNTIGVDFSFNSSGGVGYDANGNFDVSAGAANTGNATISGFVNLGSDTSAGFCYASGGGIVFTNSTVTSLDGDGTASLAGVSQCNQLGKAGSIALASSTWMAVCVGNVTNTSQGYGDMLEIRDSSSGTTYVAMGVTGGSSDLYASSNSTIISGPAATVNGRYVASVLYNGEILFFRLNGTLVSSTAVASQGLNATCDISFGDYFPGVMTFGAFWGAADETICTTVEAACMSSWGIS